QGRDLLTVRTDGSVVLYRDRLAGIWEAQELAINAADAHSLLAIDVDGDSRTDVLEHRSNTIRWWRNERPDFAPPAVLATSHANPVLADLDNRGTRDLLTSVGGTSFAVDHDEHIQIPGDALVESDGSLEIR